jgi:hypothetical protein
MARRSITNARCEALFASALQPSDAATAEAVSEAIRGAVCEFGVVGCMGLVAQEFGDHPEAACLRMRWVRQLVGELYARALTQTDCRRVA